MLRARPSPACSAHCPITSGQSQSSCGHTSGATPAGKGTLDSRGLGSTWHAPGCDAGAGLLQVGRHLLCFSAPLQRWGTQAAKSAHRVSRGRGTQRSQNSSRHSPEGTTGLRPTCHGMPIAWQNHNRDVCQSSLRRLAKAVGLNQHQ